MTNKAFTLVELLVVILILGILSAIVIPQYHKAIWRSKTKGMLFNLKAMYEGVHSYYLANNTYPTKLSDLDISFNGYTNTCIRSGPLYTNDSCVANENSNLFLSVVNNYASGASFAQFNSGPYRSAGFMINYKGGISCYESTSYITTTGNFCEKVMGCRIWASASDQWDKYFKCPDL